MNPHCPKCEDQPLTTVARGVMKCPRCGGTFVARGAVADASASPAAPSAGHDAAGGQCPNDRTIMTRTEVDLGPNRPPVHLERCNSCYGVWFDAGEWSALAERQLIEHLDDLWTAEWRASQRRAREEAQYEQRLRAAFGPELFDALQSLATQLRGHERRSQALAFLREESEE